MGRDFFEKEYLGLLAEATELRKGNSNVLRMDFLNQVQQKKNQIESLRKAFEQRQKLLSEEVQKRRSLLNSVGVQLRQIDTNSKRLSRQRRRNISPILRERKIEAERKVRAEKRRLQEELKEQKRKAEQKKRQERIEFLISNKRGAECF